MNSHISLTPKQLFSGILLVVFATAAVCALFLLIGMRLVSDWDKAHDQSASLVTDKSAELVSRSTNLPRAMTATPRARQVEMLSFTNETLSSQLQHELVQSNSPLGLQVERVEIDGQQIRLAGSLEGSEINGAIEMSGLPEVLDGRLVLRLGEVWLNGQALPAGLFPSLENEINQVLEQWFWGMDILRVDLFAGRLDLSIMKW